jgi:hypothetical protein
MRAIKFYCGAQGKLYLLYPGELIQLPKFHCKQCHHTSVPRVSKAPKRCTNRNGYIDENGQPQKACASQQWNKWPEGFEPEKAQCSHCKILWAMEQEGIKPPQSRRPGRPYKNYSDDKESV